MSGLFKSHYGAGRQECLISVLLFYFLQFYKLAKKMKKLLILSVMILSVAFSLVGQGDLNEQQRVFFRNERSFGIVLNTDGYGFSYRGAKGEVADNANQVSVLGSSSPDAGRPLAPPGLSAERSGSKLDLFAGGVTQTRGRQGPGD